MSDMISRQTAISAICNACGKIDCDKMDKCEKLQLLPANSSEFPNNSDLISRQAAIDCVTYDVEHTIECLKALPSAQPETCEGCKHLGKWENEVEYGYSSPCTRCKRMVGDNYER